MAEPGLKIADPQDDKLSEFFKTDGKPEAGTEIPGFEGSQGEEKPTEKPVEKPEVKPEDKHVESEVKFKDGVKEGDEIKVGEEAAPDGDYPMEDGSTAVIKDGKIESIKPKEEESPADWNFDIGKFNDMFGTEYKSDVTFREDLAALNTLKEDKIKLEGKVGELTEKFDTAKKALDPMQYFANEEEYKRQLILKKYGEEVNPAALNKIVATDLNTLTDIDVLVLGEMVRNPNVIEGESGAREMIYDKLQIDPEDSLSDLTTLQKNKIASAATSIRLDLNKLKDIEIPQVGDFEAETAATAAEKEKAKTDLTAKWDKVTDTMLANFNHISVQDDVDGKKADVFSYAVTDEFKEAAKADLVEFMAENGHEPTEENLKDAVEHVQERFVRENFTAMLLAHGTDVETKVKQELEEKYANAKPLEDKLKPSAEVDQENKELFDKVRLSDRLPAEGAPLFKK